MVTDKTAGSATGIAATVRISAKSRVSTSGSPRNSATIRINATRPSVMRIRKLPIFKTAFWKCDSVCGGLDQARRAAEEGVHPGGHDHPPHFAHSNDRSRVRKVVGFLVDRQRFPGKRRLVDADVFAFEQFQIGRHDVAEFDQHDIPRHEGLCFQVAPLAVAQHAGAQREILPERFDRVVGFELLPESDAGVDQQHRAMITKSSHGARSPRERRRPRSSTG